MPRKTLFGTNSTLVLLLIICFATTYTFSSVHTASADEKIRESVLAGTWYPGDPEVLRKQIKNFLKNVKTSSGNEKLLGLIVPHAGYRYSGQVAAHAYKLLENRSFETVVIIAPSHRALFEGVSVYDRGGYRTPLGVVPINREFIHLLKQKDPRIRYVPEAHAREHSLEIQLPFLQVVLPNLKIVPLVMGDQNYETCKKLADILAQCIQRKSVLLVASTDLSHFHSYNEAKKLDARVLEHVEKMDAKGLHSDLTKGICEACGGGPMVTAMLTAAHLQTTESQILNSANSGDVTRDRSKVVGYMSAALWASSGKIRVLDNSAPLSSEDKALLHKIARNAVEASITGKKAVLPNPLPPSLKKKCGAFVTLYKNDKLRGCIGCLSAKDSLANTVQNMAASAALKDPRFPVVKKDELKDITYEISVLSSLQRVSNIKDIHVGTHGIYIKKGRQKGALLPQVATQ